MHNFLILNGSILLININR